MCDMGNKLWYERDLCSCDSFTRHLLVANPTGTRSLWQYFSLVHNSGKDGLRADRNQNTESLVLVSKHSFYWYLEVLFIYSLSYVDNYNLDTSTSAPPSAPVLILNFMGFLQDNKPMGNCYPWNHVWHHQTILWCTGGLWQPVRNTDTHSKSIPVR